jgi:hypothetical protein
LLYAKCDTSRHPKQWHQPITHFQPLRSCYNTALYTSSRATESVWAPSNAAAGSYHCRQPGLPPASRRAATAQAPSYHSKPRVWGPRSSSRCSCTCICITKHFFSLTDTAASASAILLQPPASTIMTICTSATCSMFPLHQPCVLHGCCRIKTAQQNNTSERFLT